MTMTPAAPGDISGARALAVFGDSITTDHISPAGAIKPDSPAGPLSARDRSAAAEFNSYGARRGNHEVMMRGTFANIRIRNRMLDNVEGGFTRYAPTGEVDGDLRRGDGLSRRTARPLVVIAGKEYGTGSSRDWAAKGTVLLGVRAVIAESFERIHRSNLVGMGVLPLQFPDGESAESLGLDGTEKFTIAGDRRASSRARTSRSRSRRADGASPRLHRPLPHRYLQRARIFRGRRHPPVRAAEAGGLSAHRPACGRGGRLGRGGADPARLSAALGGQAHRPDPRLSVDERRRRGRDSSSTAGGTGHCRPRRSTSVAADWSRSPHGEIADEKRIVDLSHVITDGMMTYKGLPGPHICDFWTREQSAANYDDGSTFQIGRIDMVANTGTYVDIAVPPLCRRRGFVRSWS